MDSQADESSILKEAGRRDFDNLIAQAAEELENEQSEDLSKQAEDEAEASGAAYFETVLKQAALDEALQENEQLKAKLAEFSQYIEQVNTKEAAEQQAQYAVEQQAKLAEAVANVVLEKLKSEAAATKA